MLSIGGGDEVDMVKPPLQRELQAGKRFGIDIQPKKATPHKNIKLFTGEYGSYDDLQLALVPERTAEERYEINRRYLNHVSNGQFG